MLNLFRRSQRSSILLQISFKSLSISSVKCKKKFDLSNLFSEIIIKNETEFLNKPKKNAVPKKWDEKKAVKENKRYRPFFQHEDNEDAVDLLKRIQNTRNFPLTIDDFNSYLKRRRFKIMMLEQKFLPRRHAILKPDLAATHFILRRGGSVKFLAKDDWIGGPNGKDMELPTTYVPGYNLEGINAENTNLYIEGLKNLCNLRHLKWLSLKGLEEIDDWCLDYVSKEYYKTLEYLDISNCINVTYRGFSCFYRFENLKTIVVEGVPESVELKLACIMLQDLMPELEIKGIKLDVPEKIEPVDIVNVP